MIQLRLLKRRTEDVDAESEELEQTPIEIPMEEFQQKVTNQTGRWITGTTLKHIT